MTHIVWFRNDLRTIDNPALDHACKRGTVSACFIVCLDQWRQHDVGENRLAFLWRSVQKLQTQLAHLGIPLKILRAAGFDDVPEVLTKHATAIKAQSLSFNREYPLNEYSRDKHACHQLEKQGIEVAAFDAAVTLAPGSVLTQNDTPYTVFTPFKRRWLELVHPTHITPLPVPRAQASALVTEPLAAWPGVASDTLEALWPAGEDEAQRRLATFISNSGEVYGEQRDFPAIDGTSALSAYLAVGAISPNQCLHAALCANGGKLKGGPLDTWISELIWREFYKHIIALFPAVSRGREFNARYAGLPWRHAPDDLLAWQAGQTGYPLVDAAMQQLNQTGWMHNRLRMVSAMFLTKHLLIDWRAGERYFMQLLVDGDFASNNGGWQWSASTGTDAAPYFRIFNPATQGQRFDGKGLFTRQMLPELSDVPNKQLFTPHESGLQLDYPLPLVAHKFARERAINTFKSYLD